MSKMVGYARVSTKDQNLARQIDDFIKLGIQEKNIYSDKQSGKNFERVEYYYMKKCLEAGDTLVIKDLKRLGRNRQELKAEWEYFMDNNINIRVLDIPSLNISYDDDEQLKPMLQMIKSVVFDILSWEAEEQRRDILETQRQGIESAKKAGTQFGRPKKLINTRLFKQEYEKWKNNEQTACKAMKNLGWSRTFFYDVVKKYEKEILPAKVEN